MKTKYDWSNVPKEVNWIATDADSIANGFVEEPKPVIGNMFDMWISNNDSESYVSISLLNSYKFGVMNWQESLEERPK